MDVITLDAQPRELGSTAARAVRRSGEVPCVIYGPHQEPVHFRVPVLELRHLIYTSETHRVQLKLDGQEFDCIVKKIDFHPVTDVPVHVDFYALTAGEEITLTIPVTLVGLPVGVQAGGSLTQPLNEIEIRCIPANIPGNVEIDVSALEIGDAVHVSDIEAGDFVIVTEPDRTVASVSAPMAEEIEEEPEELLLEGEEIPGEGEGEGAEEAGGEETEPEEG
jgi:large subunit ribosomal protein L25